MTSLLTAIMLSFPFSAAFLSAAPKTTPPFNSASVYGTKPSDPMASVFNAYEYSLSSDGRTDVTDALQQAINTLKKEKGYGVLFIPEGRYRITHTVTIPPSIRLVGFGSRRPVFVLNAYTPGYQGKDPVYMFHFTGNFPTDGSAPQDANPGTFYSAISNIDFTVEQGNPATAVIRAHFAQHCFISHCDFNMVDAFCGVHEAGNELEDLRFFGGQYGINTSRASPGWPIMMMDCYFTGQSKAAVLTREAGISAIGVHAASVPVVFDMEEGIPDRLSVEESLFENVTDAGIRIGAALSTATQLNISSLQCTDVPSLVCNKATGGTLSIPDRSYIVKDYCYGLILPDLSSVGEIEETLDYEPLKYKSPGKAPREKSLPLLPEVSTWVNVTEYGARGDGQVDDTEAIRRALSSGRPVYFPEGLYRVTSTVKMPPGASIIGLHPFSCQIVLSESESAFSGFGTPVPVVESSEGGENILSGVGISTGAYNYRAVGLKWMAGEHSLVNDVKFVGGHGTLRRPSPPSGGAQPSSVPRPQGQGPSSFVSSPTAPRYSRGGDLAWDNQYWSLWVQGGGGTIKNIWSASTYCAAGIYISDTEVPGRILGMSLEHHVRTEARMSNVKGWSIHCLQFEEEGTEGPMCYNMDMSGCEDIRIVNCWMYRVIRARTPKDRGMRLWDCRNIQIRNLHNYTQVIPVIEYPVYDMVKGRGVAPWDFARLTVTGEEPLSHPRSWKKYLPERLCTGLSYPTGAVSDRSGRAFFCENATRKIYMYDPAKGSVTLLADYPWKPFSLSVDSKDNVLVSFRYDPQPGLMVDGRQESVETLPDDNPYYSGWGNGGWRALMYSFNPDSPDRTMAPMRREKYEGEVKESARTMVVPASRWRTDYEKVVSAMPEYCYVAPDSLTVVPDTYDLGRNTSLISYGIYSPNDVFVINENDRTTRPYRSGEDGKLVPRGGAVAPRGQYSTAVDGEGNLYIADGDIFVIDKYGESGPVIHLDERPLSICIAGEGRDMLFVTCPSSVYVVPLVDGPKGVDQEVRAGRRDRDL